MFRQIGSLLIPVGLIIGVITFLEGASPRLWCRLRGRG